MWEATHDKTVAGFTVLSSVSVRVETSAGSSSPQTVSIVLTLQEVKFDSHVCVCNIKSEAVVLLSFQVRVKVTTETLHITGKSDKTICRTIR